LYQITKELFKRGHTIHVLTTNAYFTGEEKWEEGINVYRFNLVSQIFSKKNLIIPDIKFISCLKRIVKQYDCIHLHGYRNFYNVFLYRYAKKCGVPYILQAHGSVPRFTNLKWLKWIYDEFFGYRLLRDASKVIALNQAEAEQYRSMGVLDEKVEIIQNGIDMTKYTDLPPRGSFKTKYNIPLESKLILYLGRIHPSKGIGLLIKSFSLVLDRLKSGATILVLIGPDDGYMDEAKSLAESECILDSVLFTGFVSTEDKRKALVDADIFVTPSFSGFPITFLEACVTGIPIITTTLGDNLEWIDGKAGYVTPPTSSDLSDAMYRLLTDDDLREKFSENCRAVVRSKFSLEIIIEKLEQVYRSV